MLSLIQKVRQIMLDAGVSDKPLWNTESGWQVPKPFPSEELAADYLARAYILSWAAGVSRFYWYAWDNHAWASIQTTEPDNRTLTPACRAYWIVENWLAGAELNHCDEQADHTWVCRLTRDSGPSWILWNTDGSGSEKKDFAFSQGNQGSVTPLLEEPRTSSGPMIEVDQMPELITPQTSR
jgi:hypothetical protein